MEDQTYRIVALERGLKVLSAFTADRHSLGSSEVARLTGIPVSTTYRILRTLEEAEFVEQLADGNFTPGVAVLKLGFAALQNDGVVEAARVPLQELHAATGETVNLAVLTGAKVMYLIRHRTAHYVIGNITVGATLPASCTGVGKCLLAYLPSEELHQVLTTADLQTAGVGPNAHRELNGLIEDLRHTRERGWSIQNEEVAHGLRAIAAPVRNIDGVVAAVGISVEGARWPVDRLTTELLDPLTAAAQKVSLRMGYLEGVTPPPTRS
ncbi:IclR family transcriptional regulator [Cellulosimicrobium funkei]|nr:IclR family transcriptional regulator [Cellulosimicrobium funkei]